MVKIGHDDTETLVLLSDQVLNWHLDIFESDIGRSTRPDTLAVHSPGLDTAEAALDEEDADTIHALAARSNGRGEVL